MIRAQILILLLRTGENKPEGRKDIRRGATARGTMKSRGVQIIEKKKERPSEIIQSNTSFLPGFEVPIES